jgi:integrase
MNEADIIRILPPLAEPTPYRIVKHRKKYSMAYGKPRKRIALGTTDRGLAELRARQKWNAMASETPDHRLVHIWQSYLADRASDGVRVANLKSAWKALEPHFGYKLGNMITKQDCRDYAASRISEGKAPSTARTELEFLRACLNFKYGKGRVPVWVAPASAPRQHFLTKMQASKLLEYAIAPHIHLFIVIAITTGARMGAILDLTWDRVDLINRTADFNPPGRIKTNKGRTIVPLNSRAMGALTKAREIAQSPNVIEYKGRPVLSVRKGIRATAARAEVFCSPHVLRHTAGVWMAEANVPMQKIAQFLGHSSSKVTERVYARYSPTFMQDAAAALEW